MTSGWERLGRRIQTERARKGYATAAALAAAAGVSPRTIEVIEIERALGWRPGSVQRIVEGGRPQDAADPLLERVIAAWPQMSGDDQVQLTELAERLARKP